MGVPLATTDADTGDQPIFFPVSLAKFAVMSLASFGLYDIYWMYQNWSRERDRTNEPLSPVWRSIFGILWIYSLLQRIRNRAHATGVPVGWASGVVATGFIVLSLLWRLPDPYWWVSILAFVPLLGVQHTINQTNALVAPDGDRNAKYSGINIVLIVIGVLMVALIILGSLLPPEEEVINAWQAARQVGSLLAA